MSSCFKSSALLRNVASAAASTLELLSFRGAHHALKYELAAGLRWLQAADDTSCFGGHQGQHFNIGGQTWDLHSLDCLHCLAVLQGIQLIV